MTYFHVLIKHEGEKQKLTQIFADLSEDELLQKFVLPYRKGEPFVSGNQVVQTATITERHIVQTSDNNESEREKLSNAAQRRNEAFNRESDSLVILSVGHGYDPEDILEAGTDVTDKFLAGPPGYAPGLSAGKVLSNEWVVAIATGLILLIIGAVFGLSG